ncbi:MAG: N-acylglucosamine 2-epimerase, partial [Comamonadaceae bacterium]|nr:N-acylglucosamine 2-epimerase [Comamonadaceae bacterium]
MTPAHPPPDFRSPAFLKAHIRDCMAFYHPRAMDPSGGMFHFFRDDGSVYDAHTRHLVSSTRFVFTYAMAVRSGLASDPGQPSHAQGLAHAFDFLRRAHRDDAIGGYAWQLDWRNGHKTITDGTYHAYGLAFVLLAHAHAHMAGLPEAHRGIAETFELLKQ